MSETHTGLPVSGYVAQTNRNIDLVNRNKQHEEATLRVLDDLKNEPGIDQRWLALARTNIEQGWMDANRAIFRPQRIRLPDDGADA